MASLAKSNKYLRDSKALSEMIRKNAYDSSIFEGASYRSLPKPESNQKRDDMAKSKKRAKSS